MSAGRPQLLILCPDLFFASQIEDTARLHGLAAQAVSNLDQLRPVLQAGGVTRVIVDLQDCPDPAAVMAVCRQVESGRPHVLGYGPHVKRDALEAARAAGFDEVLTRGQFSSQLVEILQQSPGARPG